MQDNPRPIFLQSSFPIMVSVSQARYILLKLKAPGSLDCDNKFSILVFPGTCSLGPSKARYSISKLETRIFDVLILTLRKENWRRPVGMFHL